MHLGRRNTVTNESKGLKGWETRRASESLKGKAADDQESRFLELKRGKEVRGRSSPSSVRFEHVWARKGGEKRTSVVRRLDPLMGMGL